METSATRAAHAPTADGAAIVPVPTSERNRRARWKRARRAPRTHGLPTAPRSSTCRRASEETRARSQSRAMETSATRAAYAHTADGAAIVPVPTSEGRVARVLSVARDGNERDARRARTHCRRRRDRPRADEREKRRARALSRARWKRARRAPRTHELPTAPRSSPCRRARERDARAPSVARDENERDARRARTNCRRRRDRPRADERGKETRARPQSREMKTSATRAAHARTADGAAIVPVPTSEGKDARALSVARDGNKRDARRARTNCRHRRDHPRADERPEETR